MATDSSKLVETSTAGHSHPSAAMLYVTFGVLMVLLAATVTADHFLEGVTGTVTGLSISVTKTALIVLIFMNLRWSSALIRLASIAAVLWLSFALMFVMGDYLTRGWCTGFRATYDVLDVYLQEGILDHEGRPIHRRGVAVGQPGLYFVGLRFQHTFVSQDIYGVGQDAAYVAEHIARRHAVATKSGVNSFSRRTETRIKQ